MARLSRSQRKLRARQSTALGDGAAPTDAGAELGVSGTQNLFGRIYSEANAKLQWERAFGHPGRAQSWGEWEKLERTDNAVGTALNLIASPLRDSIVDIELTDGNQEISDFVRDNLLEWLEPRWPQLVEQMVRYGLGYGFSLHEIVWGVRPDSRVAGGQAVFIRKLAQRLPSSVKSDGWLERDGELYAIRQAGYRAGQWADNIELPADKVLLATWNRSGNNFVGYSAFRPVWYLGQLRAELLRILAIGHARESLGVPTIERDKDTSLTEQQLDELQEMVENLVAHEKAGLVLPKGCTLNWVFSDGANKNHVLETWRALGVAILETVQAQQVALGTGETGSRSVGEVHDGTRGEFVAGVRAWLEASFNGIGSQPYTGLVRKLVSINFGEQTRYPLVRLVAKKNQLPASEFANALKTLSDGGAITLTESDENDIRERVGLAPFDPTEREAALATKAAARAALVSRGQSEAQEYGSPKGFSDFVPTRDLRQSEQIINLSAIATFFDSARDQFESMVRPIVEDMIRDSLPQIAEAMADGDPSELQSLKLNNKLLSKAVEVFVENARSFGYRQARLEVEKLGKAGDPRTKAPSLTHGLRDRLARLGAIALAADEIESAEPEFDDDLIDNLVKAQTRLVTERIANRAKQSIWAEAVDAVRQKREPNVVVATVLIDYEETKVLRQDAGIVVSRAFSMGREQFFEEAGDAIERLELSAALDMETCAVCQSFDGTVVEAGSPEHARLTPPLSDCAGRANCRCLLVPLR